MITLHVEVPYASFRKSFARSFAETYPLPPPATVNGMLLSLVGEYFRKRHDGVRLAFAYKKFTANRDYASQTESLQIWSAEQTIESRQLQILSKLCAT